MWSMINVVYAERLLFDIRISVLCLSLSFRTLFCAQWCVVFLPTISSRFQCLSFVFISNKPTCFMVMWRQRESKRGEKNAFKWHDTYTTHITYQPQYICAFNSLYFMYAYVFMP